MARSLQETIEAWNKVGEAGATAAQLIRARMEALGVAAQTIRIRPPSAEQRSEEER